MALEVLKDAEDAGFATARVVGTSTGVGMDFAAIAPLLVEAGPGLPGAGGVQMLRRLGAAMAQRAGGRHLALMVDDAHSLDSASALVVYQLATSGVVLLLVTLRSRETAPEPITDLWKEGILERFELPGLDGEAVSEVLTGALGGPVALATVARLAASCGGNLLFLRELRHAAARSEITSVGSRLAGRSATRSSACRAGPAWPQRSTISRSPPPARDWPGWTIIAGATTGVRPDSRGEARCSSDGFRARRPGRTRAGGPRGPRRRR